MTHYLLIVRDDIEPEVIGGFSVPESRDFEAKCERQRDPEGRNGLFRLDVDEHGVPSAYSFSAAELQL